jgi:uncharacterized membrane protein YqaE (UPF0057 family)
LYLGIGGVVSQANQHTSFDQLRLLSQRLLIDLRQLLFFASHSQHQSLQSRLATQSTREYPTSRTFELLTTTTMSAGDIFLGLIAILFPPIAVWIKRGLCSADSLINIALCMLGFVPGLLHAWYIIASYPEENLDYEPIDEESRVTYVVVSGPNRNYGTSGQGRPQGPGQVKGNMPPSVAAHSKPNPPPAPRPEGNGEGSSAGPQQSGDAPPPTYADAVKGDHKIQSQD